MFFDKPTKELEGELLRSANVEDFIQDHQDSFLNMTLAEYIRQMISEKGLNERDVKKASDIDKTYIHEIFKGKKKNVDRNKLLRLAFALQLDSDETQRLLTIGGRSRLYVRNERDCVILYALDHGKTLREAEEELYQNGYDTIYDNE